MQVQAGERHVLEHLDVTWDNGVDGRRVRRNGESSEESSLGDALGPHPQQMSLLSALPTCELVALYKVELLDLHALKHLDVAWGSGVEGRDTS